MIKLIACDLDGTLLTDKKEISPLTGSALDYAVKRGIYFIPATGRPMRAVPEKVLAIGGVDLVITSNGAAVYSMAEKKRIYECLMPKEAVDKILMLEIPEKMTFEVLVEGIPHTEQRYVDHPEQFGATEFGVSYIKATRQGMEQLREFAALHRRDLDGINFICPDAAVRDEFRRKLECGIPNIRITSSVTNLIEVSHEKATKGSTLEWLLHKLNIPRDHAMAFGDADNDLEMLSGVKYGIAMKNATEDCKAAAYLVTDTNEKDGVGKMILRMLGQGENSVIV